MRSAPSIEPADAADAGAVADVYAAAWPPSAAHASTADVRDELLKTRGRAFWEREIAEQTEGPGLFLVAKHDGEIVAFAGSAFEHDGAWELRWLFVAPGWQGRGVAAKLYEALLVHSASSKPRERFLWAVPGNLDAERFYARRGWQTTSSIKDVPTVAGSFPLRKWTLAVAPGADS